MPTCPICNENYSKKILTDVIHGLNYDCDLQNYTGDELFKAAKAAYDRRISQYVRTFYTRILAAVERGKFQVTFDFECDEDDDRQKLLSTVIVRLKAKFRNVLFSTDSGGHEFEVAWGSATLPGETSTPLSPQDVAAMHAITQGSAFFDRESSNQAKTKEEIWQKYIGQKYENQI